MAGAERSRARPASVGWSEAPRTAQRRFGVRDSLLSLGKFVGQRYRDLLAVLLTLFVLVGGGLFILLLWGWDARNMEHQLGLIPKGCRGIR